jgi:hypothetical protein
VEPIVELLTESQTRFNPLVDVMTDDDLGVSIIVGPKDEISCVNNKAF